MLVSHLTRGAWIEMAASTSSAPNLWRSHLTRGAWIEIFKGNYGETGYKSRTSHEVRGLKYELTRSCIHWIMSHLTRGAWIEIMFDNDLGENMSVAPHTRCVD